ncbi:MAG TPA: hypothetical protein VMY37_15300 [Thermoguttaceae bacterium]|nr:hypothetical protein [Thermoguttaceae bacterium]
MARTYAGILGSLALLMSLARGFLHAQSTDTMLFTAWCSLMLFAAVGYVVGGIAARTVEESVIASVQSRLTQEESSEEAREAPSIA